MKYTKEEQIEINNHLKSLGTESRCADIYEYKEGQLLEFVRNKKCNDSMLTWDEWHWLQVLLEKEISLELAVKIIGMLWENEVEVLELKNDASRKYEEEFKQRREVLENAIDLVCDNCLKSCSTVCRTCPVKEMSWRKEENEEEL